VRGAGMLAFRSSRVTVVLIGQRLLGAKLFGK
jgi:hypothetical protein